MECGDWSEVLYNNLEEFVANWFMDNINSFAVEWIMRPPLLGESLNSTIFNFKEHNLIRISIGTDNPKYIYILIRGNQEVKNCLAILQIIVQINMTL